MVSKIAEMILKNTNDLENNEASYKIKKLFEPITGFMVKPEDEIYNKCNKCFKKEGH